MTSIYPYIDRSLIAIYRLVDIPIIGYFIGTAVLCLICVVAGHLTLTLVYRVNRKTLERENRAMVKMHNLSLRALVAKDKTAYTSCNKEANEQFGKVFFQQIAMGVSSLWPIPFALAWMQTRFGRVDFPLPFELPLIGDTVGFTFTFFPIYVLAYILFHRLRRRITLYRKAQHHIEAEDEERLLSLTDFH